MTTGCRYIDDYAAALRSGVIPASKELLKALDLIERKLSDPRVTIDSAKTERARELIEKYFRMHLLDWEMFILALVHCYYEDDTLVFTEFLVVMGRGNGKNGFISALSWYLTTEDHGIDGYNVDIIANSEDQARTSFDDIYQMLEDNSSKLQYFYKWTKEEITSLRTRSYIKYNTSNARTKDGKRSACLIFDEVHEYESDENIRVFRSGFGKRRHCRIFKITTNGYVRDGVLDRDLDLAKSVLEGEIPNSRLCPLIYKVDTEDEVKDPAMWVKANPSLPYFPALRVEMEQEFSELPHSKTVELDFYTKRMNLPRSETEVVVTEWENIAATNRPLPDDLEGRVCTVGIDFASIRDFASVNIHFRIDDKRYDISHSWLCLRSPDLGRIKAPWREWAELGYLTPVDDVSIPAYLLTEYIKKAAEKYHIEKLALDNFRYSLIKEELATIGFDAKTAGNVYLVRPSDIMQVQPIIDSCFAKRLFTWGDAPVLRWATNNTKLVRAGRKEGTDTGNYYYAKIEAKSRKTDPFMGLVASMCVEVKNIGSGGGFEMGALTA